MTAEFNRRSVLQAIGLGGGIAFLAGCGASRTAPAQTGGSTAGGISFRDQQGRTITFDRPVTSVVTIPMPAASLLVAVDGGADHLAAMHNASWVAMRDGILGTIFPKALELPHDIATQDFTPNVESIRALNPDVVIQWSDAQLVAPLENAGLKVIGLVNNGTQEDVDAWIAMFAAMLGKPERATEIKDRSDRELAEVKDLAAGRNGPGPSILYFNRFVGGLKAAAAKT
jgi:iron complex transport system substrate-binding protein